MCIDFAFFVGVCVFDIVADFFTLSPLPSSLLPPSPLSRFHDAVILGLLTILATSPPADALDAHPPLPTPLLGVFCVDSWTETFAAGRFCIGWVYRHVSCFCGRL